MKTITTKTSDELAILLNEIMTEFKQGDKIIKTASTMSNVNIQEEINSRLNLILDESISEEEKEKLKREARIFSIISLRRKGLKTRN